jgi:hypothetical protein
MQTNDHQPKKRNGLSEGKFIFKKISAPFAKTDIACIFAQQSGD